MPNNSVMRLHLQLQAVGIPVIMVSGNPAPYIQFDPRATFPQQSQGNAMLASFDWSDAADAAYWTARNVDPKIQALTARVAALEAKAGIVSVP